MKKGENKNARTIARLTAVQALYEMEISGKNATQSVQDISNRCHMEDMAVIYQQMGDQTLFENTVKGVVKHQKELDSAIHEFCVRGGRILPNLDVLLRSLLRAGAWEMIYMDTIPYKVTINEYLNIAHQFFGGGETRFINGILDALAEKQNNQKTQNEI